MLAHDLQSTRGEWVLATVIGMTLGCSFSYTLPYYFINYPLHTWFIFSTIFFLL
jgi:hypothetical protein